MGTLSSTNGSEPLETPVFKGTESPQVQTSLSQVSGPQLFPWTLTFADLLREERNYTPKELLNLPNVY